MTSNARESSVIIPTRGHGENLEVFWSRRQPHLRFLGAFHAFFGGSVDPGDSDTPLHGPIDYPDPRFYGCAARELFEESGLLVVDAGLAHVGAPDTGPHDIRGARRAVLDGELEFNRWLNDHRLRVDASRFHHLGRWITPEFSQIRFDSHFFVVDLTGAELESLAAERFGEHLSVEELQRGEWVRPDDALRRWRSGELFISPPIRFALDALRDAPRGDQAFADQDDVTSVVEWAEASGGIYLLPLASPTIPPATHTNCYLVGEDRFVIIDPGSPDPSENELLFELIDEVTAAGRTFEAIVLTHHHIDHVSGVEQVLDRWDVPVWAHSKTADRLDERWSIDRSLTDGETIDLGPDSLEVIFTPGHASGHVALLHERTGTAIVGDLVASFGTILINPPDGHMGDYLESLRRVRDLEPAAIFPAHGWVVAEAIDRLQFYVDHRLEREAKVHAALKRFGKPATAAEIVPDAYDDTPSHIWPIAARSALAHLIHLVEIGAATRAGERFEIV